MREFRESERSVSAASLLVEAKPCVADMRTSMFGRVTGERKRRFYDPHLLPARDTWSSDRPCCGHDVSARRAADALTIITTCEKLGIEPRSNIRDTLRRILDGEKDLSLLVPENYKPDIAMRGDEPVAA